MRGLDFEGGLQLQEAQVHECVRRPGGTCFSRLDKGDTGNKPCMSSACHCSTIRTQLEQPSCACKAPTEMHWQSQMLWQHTQSNSNESTLHAGFLCLGSLLSGVGVAAVGAPARRGWSFLSRGFLLVALWCGVFRGRGLRYLGPLCQPNN